jgi:hypothetical protein
MELSSIVHYPSSQVYHPHFYLLHKTVGIKYLALIQSPVLSASPHAGLQPVLLDFGRAMPLAISHYVETPANALIHIHHEIQYRSSVVSSNTISMSVLWQA